MTTYERLRVHPERPQIRQINRAVEFLKDGAFVVVPTETTYAMMMLPTATDAQASVRQLRGLDENHLWSLVCRDMSQASEYVKIDNQAHRVLKRHLPGPFTFILPASSTLPKRVFGKRRDIGLRMPEHAVCQMLLDAVGGPLLATSMQFMDHDEVAISPDLIDERARYQHCALIDAGWCGSVPTTIVDLCGEEPEMLRQGLGIWE